MPITERANLDFSSLPFGYLKTDYNVRYTWRDGKWDDGIETDSEILPLHMAATCLHYGQEAFEGLKVYEAKDGRILGFRIAEIPVRWIDSADSRVHAVRDPITMFLDLFRIRWNGFLGRYR